MIRWRQSVPINHSSETSKSSGERIFFKIPSLIGNTTGVEREKNLGSFDSHIFHWRRNCGPNRGKWDKALSVSVSAELSQRASTSPSVGDYHGLTL